MRSLIASLGKVNFYRNRSRIEIICSKNMRWIDQLARPRTEPRAIAVVAAQTEGDSAMSTTTVNTVIVGAGQAGLAVSYYLSKLSQDHIVLEQADRPGEAWRNHRWDSFTEPLQ